MDELACFVPGMLALGASGYGPEKAEQIMNLAKEVIFLSSLSAESGLHQQIAHDQVFTVGTTCSRIARGWLGHAPESSAPCAHLTTSAPTLERSPRHVDPLSTRPLSPVRSWPKATATVVLYM